MPEYVKERVYTQLQKVSNKPYTFIHLSIYPITINHKPIVTEFVITIFRIRYIVVLS